MAYLINGTDYDAETAYLFHYKTSGRWAVFADIPGYYVPAKVYIAPTEEDAREYCKAQNLRIVPD